MGTCTGVLSSCAIAGYAMESRCHLGRKRVYDTVTRYGWSVDVRTHRIGIIIDKLLAEDWDKPGDDGSPRREVPELTWDDEGCDVGTLTHSFKPHHSVNTPLSELPTLTRMLQQKEECYSWEYGHFKNASDSSLCRTFDDLHSC